MIKFHSICFTSWSSFRNYIAEVLIVIDAGLAVLTLGILEVNFSVVYMNLMDEIYGKAEDRNSW